MNDMLPTNQNATIRYEIDWDCEHNVWCIFDKKNREDVFEGTYEECRERVIDMNEGL